MATPRGPRSKIDPEKTDASPDPLDASEMLELSMDDQVPEALDPSALSPIEELPEDAFELRGTPEIDNVPLVDGFIATRQGSDSRRTRNVLRAPAPKTEFEHTHCPSCREEQPSPAPSFCEACGQRLRKPKSKMEMAADDRKKCGECGIRNRMDAPVCSNCGSKFKSDLVS